MTMLHDVTVGALSLDRFAAVFDPARVAAAREVSARLRRALGCGVLWNVSSTAVGGGVAEMLPSLLAYS